MSRRVLVGLLVVGVLLAAGGGFLTLTSSRDPGPPPVAAPPTAPTDLRTKVSLCAPPRCAEVRLDVEVRWTPPSGDVTAIRVERNGSLVADDLEPDAARFAERDITLTQALRYRVRASGPGGTSPWAVTTAPVPMPPTAAAKLDGSYDVTLEVVRATNLGRLDGIRDPDPGDRRRVSWALFARCEAARPCTTSWDGVGTLEPRGAIYQGAFVESMQANCFSGDEAPIDRQIHLRVLDAGIEGGRWVVTRFEGTTTISFFCPGGAVSIGTMRFTGRAT